jgi:membrane-associated phospholipid phosphatase
MTAVMAGAPGILGKHDFLEINDFSRHTGWLHGFMRFYASDGPVLFGLLLIAGFWLARRTGDPRRLALAVWAAIGTVLAVAINQPIVHAVHEARPYATLPHVLLLTNPSTDASFPSDHATMAGAVAIGLLLLSRRLGVGTSIAALLLAFSRVYIGAHYPRDVVAGLALGAAIVLGGALIALPLLTRLITYLQGTRLRPMLARADRTAG